MRERFKHLNSVEDMQSPNDPEFARWADTRLDRWLIDWSLRNGKEKTAKLIADDRGVEVSKPTKALCYTEHSCRAIASRGHRVILRHPPN